MVLHNVHILSLLFTFADRSTFTFLWSYDEKWFVCLFVCLFVCFVCCCCLFCFVFFKVPMSCAFLDNLHCLQTCNCIWHESISLL